ncbi:hypothetical protein [Streptomyces sp. NPDC051569]|uniref:hypothetical protein n=1 Tax=Streptomyces sp. NPDC051569 TaxID=3365661 RepID=UPI0037A284E0
MSVITLAILGAAVAIITALLLARPARQAGTRELRRRFGPEFDRVSALHGGDARAAGRELGERLRRFHGLRIQTLPVARREQYAAQWDGLQEQFIDCPGAVATRADQLLSRLATDLGFPADPRDLQFAALSVHHPERVEDGRLLHAAARRAEAGEADAEAMRTAMVAGRALFDRLVGPVGTTPIITTPATTTTPAITTTPATTPVTTTPATPASQVTGDGRAVDPVGGRRSTHD